MNQDSPDQDNSSKAKRRVRVRRPWNVRLRNYFLTGLVASMPIAVTTYVSLWAGSLVDDIPPSLFPTGSTAEIYWQAAAPPGLGIVVVVTVVMLIGWLTTNFLGRWLLRISDNVLDKLPVIRTIYKTVKQISDSLSSSSNSFDSTVLVQYPMAGTWVIGYLAGITTGEIHKRLGPDEYLSVYIPTTPNPTSGYLVFVKRKDTIPLDMSIIDSSQMIISAGLITPEWTDPDASAKAIEHKEHASNEDSLK